MQACGAAAGDGMDGWMDGVEEEQPCGRLACWWWKGIICIDWTGLGCGIGIGIAWCLFPGGCWLLLFPGAGGLVLLLPMVVVLQYEIISVYGMVSQGQSIRAKSIKSSLTHSLTQSTPANS